MPEASASALQVWVAQAADFDVAATRELEAPLDATELVRAARFRHEADRKAYVLAHALRRVVLADWLGVAPRDLVFAKEESGRPLLVHPRDDALYFSHSRSREWVACAVTRIAPVGVDVEPVRAGTADESLIARFVVPDDDACVPSEEERASRFYLKWTALEAFWKAQGKGLADGNPRIAIRADTRSQHEVWLEGESQGPHARVFSLQQANGACIALALLGAVEAQPQLFNANKQLSKACPPHEMLSLR
jgi:4'-phosphopantetheinyl transferase